MKKSWFNILSVFIAFVFFISSSGVLFVIHTCSCEKKSWIYIIEQEHCNNSTTKCKVCNGLHSCEKCSTEGFKQQKDNCCSNEFHYLKIKDNFDSKSRSKVINIQIPVLPVILYLIPRQNEKSQIKINYPDPDFPIIGYCSEYSRLIL